MLGFQDRARQQAAVQVRNALALLNANGEIPWDDTDVITDTVIVTVSADVTAATGFAITGTADFIATAGQVTLVQNALYALIDDFDLQGSANILVTLTNEGTVTVTSP